MGTEENTYISNRLSFHVSQREFINVSPWIRERGEALGEQVHRSGGPHCHRNCKVGREPLDKIVKQDEKKKGGYSIKINLPFISSYLEYNGG